MNILITGASSGIGYQTALRLASNAGNKIFALSRRGDLLDKLHQEAQTLYGFSNIIPITADLKTVSDQQLYESIAIHTHSLDIIFNNAAVLVNKPMLEITDADLSDTYNTNVFSIFKTTRSLFPLLKQALHPHIINVSSIGGLQTTSKFSGLSAYSSSKGAVTILTECMAQEFDQYNIKVNALAFGAVQTNMLSKAFPNYKAPVSDVEISELIVQFFEHGYRFFNGKVLPIANSIP